MFDNQSRFTPVLEVINRTKTIKLQAACFAFINWIIDSEDDVRVRYELRSELEEADIASLTDVSSQLDVLFRLFTCNLALAGCNRSGR